ncbi:hypothetical protein HDU83_000598 [Entophlyctis luteolus]|nr:hypothetical protein HDU83_000598 [Entophlyctis luteolus]KAJ3389474.1 hypothetical protein HDU84_008697 [Entophlyctis sp. JEL0112]
MPPTAATEPVGSSGAASSTAAPAPSSSSSSPAPSSSSPASTAPPPATSTTSTANVQTTAPLAPTSSDAIVSQQFSTNTDSLLTATSFTSESAAVTSAGTTTTSASSSSSSTSNSTTVLVAAMFGVAIVGAIIGITWFKYRAAKRHRNAARYGRGVGFERDDAVSYGNISPRNAASAIGGAGDGRRSSVAIDRQQYYSELFVRGQQKANLNADEGVRRGSSSMASEQLLLHGNSAPVAANVGEYGAFGNR